MKSLLYVALALLFCLSFVSLSLASSDVYDTSSLEFVDHVDHDTLGTAAVIEGEGVEGEHAAMVETEQQEEGSHFVMESEAEIEAEEAADREFGLTDQSFIDLEESDEINTDVLRQMALEIHDSAQENIGENDEVLLELDTEVDMGVESESEVGEWQYDPLLSKQDNAQARADWLAELADRKAELADKKEAAADVKAAVAEAKLAAVSGGSPSGGGSGGSPSGGSPSGGSPSGGSPSGGSPSGGSPSGGSPSGGSPSGGSPSGGSPSGGSPSGGSPSGGSPSGPSGPASGPSGPKEVVTLPADLSDEHRETIRLNRRATDNVKSALAEVGGILKAKDDTIRGLVANITYLTVNIGKLANKVDLQRSYIGLLRQKLREYKIKNKQLRAHSKHTADTVISVRQQLKNMERRLIKQDQSSDELETFLATHKGTKKLPNYSDNLEIKGTPVTSPKVALKTGRRRRGRSFRVRPTGVVASSEYTYTHTAPGFFPTPAGDVAYAPSFLPGENIPTIVVERSDDGS